MCNQKTIDGINSGKLIAVPKWLSIINYISFPSVVLLGFYFGIYITDIDGRTFENARERDQVMHEVRDNTDHRLDIDVHMPYERKAKVFVPRTEVEYKLESMNKNIEKIMKKLNVN